MKRSSTTLRSYITGFILSIILTLAAYLVVQQFITHQSFSSGTLIFLVCVLAITQVVVQLFFFLHLGKEGTADWNLISLLYTVLLVVFLVGGSLWIMYHLDYNMMLMSPSEVDAHMIDLQPFMLRSYISLTKPGIIMGNMITASGGFFLASRGSFDPALFLWMLIGLSFIIASGCVINNYFDRDIDVLMVRTKDRALAMGTIAPWKAIIFAVCLGVLGVLILYLYTNLLTLGIALFGAFVYIVLYTLWFKRRSVKSTFVGSLSGAVPPVIGYCAVTNTIDTAAIILFLILVLWQMPHFFAIALYRLEDYVTAGIPVLPVKRGVMATKIWMILSINAFIVAVLALTVLDYTGYFYALVMGVLGIVWLVLAITGFKALDTKKWARRMFFLSLVIIVAFSLLIGINTI